MWKEIDWGDGYITYSGELPNYLYRYRSINTQNIDRLIDFELCDEAVFLAGLGDLNDPSEGRFLVKFSEDEEVLLKYFLKGLQQEYPDDNQRYEIAKQCIKNVVNSDYRPSDITVSNYQNIFGKIFRVACFTEDPLNKPMWANYAKFIDGNQVIDRAGICIEYKASTAFKTLNIHPVIYDDAIPNIIVNESIQDFSSKIFYTKESSWSYEKEWRISAILQSQTPFPKNLATNAKVKLNSAISAIIFGEKTPQNIVDIIIERVKAANSSIEFRKAVWSLSDQELIMETII